jgi:hypothetical protein
MTGRGAGGGEEDIARSLILKVRTYDRGLSVLSIYVARFR